MKAKKRTLKKRSTLRRYLSDLGESYNFVPNPGITFVFSFREGRNKTIGIYGDPKGLRYLAKLLNDVADVDQSKIPDINCPPSDGAHYHLYNHSGFIHPKSESVILGRVDAKEGGIRVGPWL
jgi:hypothetical protein